MNHRVPISCDACDGEGFVVLPGIATPFTCDVCAGDGKIMVYESERPSFGQSAVAWVVTIGIGAGIVAVMWMMKGQL